MSNTTSQRAPRAVELPVGAPQVRITVGLGSTGQKTWVLKRAVTLVGSRRPAHIVLHDRGISVAHCLFINTGTDVLLKDLNTSTGTFCNNESADLIVLEDGDVVRVGNTSIQVAIRTMDRTDEDAVCGLPSVGPTKFCDPIRLSIDDSDRSWEFDDGAVLIGRHERAEIQLGDSSVSTRHAVIVRCGSHPILFDLGSRTGTGLNGEPFSIARLFNGDCIQVGPHSLRIEVPDLPCIGDAEGRDLDVLGTHQGEADGVFAIGRPLQGADTTDDPSTTDDRERELGEVESKLESLQASLADSWDRLNEWHTECEMPMEPIAKEPAVAEAPAVESSTLDAALRGQLHDLTRYHEQISQREKELLRELMRIRRERASVAEAEAALAKREEDLAKQREELNSRENAVTQRWTRLSGAKCAACGKPFRAGGR